MATMRRLIAEVEWAAVFALLLVIAAVAVALFWPASMVLVVALSAFGIVLAILSLRGGR